MATDDQAKALVSRPADNGSAAEQSLVDAEGDAAKHSGNGLDRSHHDDPEAEEDVAEVTTTGANQQTSQNA
jgi:hypothetical protein